MRQPSEFTAIIASDRRWHSDCGNFLYEERKNHIDVGALRDCRIDRNRLASAETSLGTKQFAALGSGDVLFPANARVVGGDLARKSDCRERYVGYRARLHGSRARKNPRGRDPNRSHVFNRPSGDRLSDNADYR